MVIKLFYCENCGMEFKTNFDAKSCEQWHEDHPKQKSE
jgi:hypothetical protein